MTFFILFAFYRNQEFLDENPTDFYGDKFTSPEELRFPNSTDQYLVIAVIVKGKTYRQLLLKVHFHLLFMNTINIYF